MTTIPLLYQKNNNNNKVGFQHDVSISYGNKLRMFLLLNEINSKYP